MNQMKGVFFVVAMATIMALLVGSINQEHITFASKGEHISNKGIDVQTGTTQDQGCEPAGGTSGITNACTATSGPGSAQTPVTLGFGSCTETNPFTCSGSSSAGQCDNLGCTSVTCVGSISGVSNCITNNGVQLTSCTVGGIPGVAGEGVFCTLAGPGTGITNSGGITESDGR